MKRYRIAVLPGDGIGPEVMAEGIKALKAVERRLQTARFELNEFPAGAGECQRGSHPLPEKTLHQCREHEAMLLGTMGLRGVPWPDGTTSPQSELRERLDLYCGLRPVRLYRGTDSPLKGYSTGAIDLMIVLANPEGGNRGRRQAIQPDANESEHTLRITRQGAQRVFEAAFEQARRRRNAITLADTSNALPSMALFRHAFEEVSQRFPTVRTEKAYAGTIVLRLVQRPHSFDVIVTESLFGDILSDLAAGLVGGPGLAPSADIGEGHAVFRPLQDPAPGDAGRGIANPVAMILSIALMLDWLGTPDMRRGAALLRQAAEFVLAQPHQRTRDLGGSLSTSQMGDLIAQAVADGA